ncbi:MAG: Rieske (2Fe-2S) protein [Thermodesulfobacteriota bacterium]
MAEHRMDRREFLAGTATLMVMVTPLSLLAGGCSSESAIKAGLPAEVGFKDGHLILDLTQPRFRALTLVGDGVKLEIPARPKPLIVTRVSPTEVAAFSSICPHGGYEVLLPERGKLMCGSGHGGLFDLRGKVLHGPPKNDLEQFEARLDKNLVLVRYPE